MSTKGMGGSSLRCRKLCRASYIATKLGSGTVPRQTDAKQKMVQAARQLIRERGYNATALSDVLELSEAPRGSVYFHFPGGKAELAVEAAEQHAGEQVEHIDQAAREASAPVDLVRAYLDQLRQKLVASDYREGCTIAPLVIEGEL